MWDNEGNGNDDNGGGGGDAGGWDNSHQSAAKSPKAKQPTEQWGSDQPSKQ